MQLSFLVAKALLEGDFASYFASLPSAADEPEPIVLREGKFERVSRMEHEERGTVTVAVMVVREVAATAEVNLPRFRLHPYAAFRRRSSSGRLARSNSSGLRYPSAEWVLALL